MAKAKPNRDEIEVYIDDDSLGRIRRVGTIYRDLHRTDSPISFQYDSDWIEAQDFTLDPRLALWKSEQHPPANNTSFGIFLDSAPDRWGRVLMERLEASRARKEGRAISNLQEMDFLLRVNDETRQGALRFRRVNGQYLDTGECSIPLVTQLAELQATCAKIESEGVEQLPEFEKLLAQLVAPGSSLGGARPKANFRERDLSLWIAKFPAKNDRYDVGAWEFVTHRLAHKAGIWVPPSYIAQFASNYRTFCVKRFDREGDSRRMYASAMTLLEKQDGEAASYLEMAQFIHEQGATGTIAADLAQLFRRVVFNVMVRNTDDHLRNHGFVRAANGWRLSKAFDMNPNRAKDSHAIALDDVSTDSELDLVMSTAEFYRLDARKAAAIVIEVAHVVGKWREEAKQVGLSAGELDTMGSIFQA
ncbi:type II toxin-antitoxin system HipA family toxin [Chitinimonas arctica]|uniref:Type II toxin-antitoxin system HipA family toxin n=1 Tax=Chitinimonas arctica TaxID=2594795 RepID=A0A516SFP1_9NEIS|nr:type II toxin-antitoxin system HipA family toxin [Chitinimonas arctica]QDQ26981.1 type II toxin-antitoxin system HipA family toxin [Chitinimonas arctica]